MCIIFLWIPSQTERSAHRVILASNRDEYVDRATARAAAWADAPWVFGGRDLVAGGSWLGVSDGGRWAALTNVRGKGEEAAARSRGSLVAEFLKARGLAAREAARNIDGVGPFNAIFGDGKEVWYVSRGERRLVSPGFHCLSNAALDTPWPKAERGLRAFRHVVETTADDKTLARAVLDDVLGDATPVGLATGTGCEASIEKHYAYVHVPLFRLGAGDYGTRTSTVVLLRTDGSVSYVERDLDPATRTWSEAAHAL
ncbi:hypothetical protein CTAYLR_003015 [Chrysophaeum taylorii]|uniref:NRDE family protein n=1 Tax=Chrysophaeum taylorii TaxID=2483200 RepID=A0AAD7U6Z3_9STRA|nr:hypothetical protein CTAYLR_003015 [Chrysophaeum taylorii]